MNKEELKKIATTIRMLSVDGVEKAKSGHPGLPMGAADFAATLWANHLRFNPKKPDWLNRDRFVLSAGHGSMLIYSLLHLFGYDLPLSELQSFRQWESKTPGHPEFGMTAGVEATTGPLGQGTANAVGMALSGKMLAARFGKDLFDYRVWALVSDGDLMEGISSEAASLAGHLKLGNLTYLYDDNHISLADPTSVCFSEDIPARFSSYGWHVQSVNGHDYDAIDKALTTAASITDRPSIICFRTTIGLGSPNKSNTSDVHGSPLGEKETLLTKENLGWPTDKPFYVPDDVKKLIAGLLESKSNATAEWEKKASGKMSELSALQARAVPAALEAEIMKAFTEGEQKADATRNLSGKAIQIVAKHCPWFIGGSADLEPSTKTLIKGTTDISAEDFSGKNVRYGVREHAMGAIANGLSYTKMWTPFTATFHVFSDYMRPTMRLAALSHLQTLFVFTHDSFWVGEDGPTHEPIEQTQSLRLIPGVDVYRPADGVETGLAYVAAMKRTNGPSALLFTRQNVPVLKRDASFTPQDFYKGGYILSGKENSAVVIVATGSEVGAAVAAAEKLNAAGTKTRVVSMPCVDVFLRQDKAYRDSVIPPTAKKISIEAGVTWGWERVVGADGLMIGIDHYGASAPGELLADKFGFTAEKVLSKIQGWL